MTQRLPFYSLIVSFALSEFANVVLLLVIPWMVYETTGRATETGLIVFIAATANVISPLVSGAWIDRIGARKMVILADAVSLVSVLLIPIMLAWVGMNFWLLVLLVLVGVVLDMPGAIARSALLPDVAAHAGIELERAHSMVETLRGGAKLLAAPLAGAMLVLFGHANALYACAGAFLVSIGLMGLVPSSAKVPLEEILPKGDFFAESARGLNWIRSQPLIRILLIAMAMLNLLLLPVAQVVLPVAVKTLYESAMYLGLIVGAHGIGLVLGSIAFGLWSQHVRRRYLFAIAFVTVGGPSYALLMLAPAPLTMAFAFLGGLALGSIRPLFDSALNRRVPPELRGRVIGAMHSIVNATQSIGFITIGFMLDGVGLQPTLMITVPLYVFTVAMLSTRPALQALDETPPSPAGIAPSAGAA